MKLTTSLAAWALCGLVALSSAAEAGLRAELKKTYQGVDANPGTFGDFFGNHICSSRDWVVVTGVRTNIDLNGDEEITPDGEVGAGAAYIYRRQSYGPPLLVQRIDARGNNQTSSGERFGSGCSIVGDELFINAAYDDSYEGEDAFPTDRGLFFFVGQVNVYKFDKGSGRWEDSPSQELRTDLAGSNRAFGSRTNSNSTVVITGGRGLKERARLVIVMEPPNGEGSGKIHVFKKKRGQWQRTQIVQTGKNKAFRSITAINNQYIAVSEALNNIDPEQRPNYRSRVLVFRSEGKRLIEKPVQRFREPRLEGETSCLFSFDASFGTTMASGGERLVLQDLCADEQQGALYVYALKKNHHRAARPFKLTQVIKGPEGLPLYGGNLFNGNQSLALSSDGQLLAVGTAFPPAFVGPDFGRVDPPVDLYRLKDEQYKLKVSIPNPNPLEGEDNPGQFWGLSNHFLTPRSGGLDLVLGATGFFGGNDGAGRAYFYELKGDRERQRYLEHLQGLVDRKGKRHDDDD